MIADPKTPGRVSAAIERIQFDDFGETLIKTAESSRDVIPDLIDNQVLSSLQGAAKGLEGLSLPTSFIFNGLLGSEPPPILGAVIPSSSTMSL